MPLRLVRLAPEPERVAPLMSAVVVMLFVVLILPKPGAIEPTVNSPTPVILPKLPDHKLPLVITLSATARAL